MSSIFDYNDPLSYNKVDSQNGFKIEDFEDLEKELKGTPENELIYATNDSEMIDGDTGFDYIDGRGGGDLISGGEDIDLILGGSGNDFINEELGSDQPSGGADRDNLVFEFFDDGVDTINDFKVGEDTIQISGVSSDADVDYNQDTASLSVNGEEIAPLAPELKDWNDDSYEVF